MIRTTVRLEENLFKEARKKAIDQRIAFAELINNALAEHLGKPRKRQAPNPGLEFLEKLTKYHAKGGPKDLAKNLDKYLWDNYGDR